jgi:hypothetical protein
MRRDLNHPFIFGTPVCMVANIYSQIHWDRFHQSLKIQCWGAETICFSSECGRFKVSTPAPELAPTSARNRELNLFII